MTKIFCAEYGILREYNPHEDLGSNVKFLYWQDPEILIVGRIYFMFFCSHPELLEFVRGASEIEVPPSKPVGAGDIKDGDLKSWSSFGLRIQTLPELKSRILELLGLSNPSS